MIQKEENASYAGFALIGASLSLNGFATRPGLVESLLLPHQTERDERLTGPLL